MATRAAAFFALATAFLSPVSRVTMASSCSGVSASANLPASRAAAPAYFACIAARLSVARSTAFAAIGAAAAAAFSFAESDISWARPRLSCTRGPAAATPPASAAAPASMPCCSFGASSPISLDAHAPASRTLLSAAAWAAAVVFSLLDILKLMNPSLLGS